MVTKMVIFIECLVQDLVLAFFDKSYFPRISFYLSPSFLKFLCIFIMSDQSNIQNVLSDAFMSESEPSSPITANRGQSSSDYSGERRTRLLADSPLTSETQREYRYIFLNDP